MPGRAMFNLIPNNVIVASKAHITNLKLISDWGPTEKINFTVSEIK